MSCIYIGGAGSAATSDVEGVVGGDPLLHSGTEVAGGEERRQAEGCCASNRVEIASDAEQIEQIQRRSEDDARMRVLGRMIEGPDDTAE